MRKIKQQCCGLLTIIQNSRSENLDNEQQFIDEKVNVNKKNKVYSFDNN